jgi:hypothetical protein
MRGLTMLVLAAAIGLVAAEAFAAGEIRLAQSSTVTNCMMGCNAQAANCQTTCLLPAPPQPPSTTVATPPTLNSTATTTCVLTCSNTLLTCQTNCARQSPSQ